MRTSASLCALLAALLLASCNTPPPQTSPAPQTQPSRETERAPGTLPDAYKHPPK
jgi:hypothetical protein